MRMRGPTPVTRQCINSQPSKSSSRHRPSKDGSLIPPRLHSTITAAFDVKQLAYEDLWSAPSCDAFWERLVNSPHPRVRDLASRVKGNIRVQELQREEAETLTESHKVELELKPRVLDPTVVLLGHDSEPRPLSAFDPDYARKVSEYKASKKGRRFFEVSYEEA